MGCFDQNNAVYRTFTKVATGFSDMNLQYFYDVLIKLVRVKPKEVVSDTECQIWFEPTIIIEVTGAEITVSQVHTCARGLLSGKTDGLALRFPRFTGRIVEDKTPEDSTSNQEIHTIYLNQKK
ncbi:MAG: ATP dependent DNA ligase [Candidatus Heimdallarchaeaceae archaeon]